MSAQTQHTPPCLVRMTHNLYTIMQAQKWKNYIAEICAAIYIEQSLLLRRRRMWTCYSIYDGMMEQCAYVRWLHFWQKASSCAPNITKEGTCEMLLFCAWQALICSTVSPEAQKCSPGQCVFPNLKKSSFLVIQYGACCHKVSCYLRAAAAWKHVVLYWSSSSSSTWLGACDLERCRKYIRAVPHHHSTG